MGHQPCDHSLFHEWLLVIGEVGTRYEARGQHSVVSVCAYIKHVCTYVCVHVAGVGVGGELVVQCVCTYVCWARQVHSCGPVHWFRVSCLLCPLTPICHSAWTEMHTTGSTTRSSCLCCNGRAIHLRAKGQRCVGGRRGRDCVCAVCVRACVHVCVHVIVRMHVCLCVELNLPYHYGLKPCHPIACMSPSLSFPCHPPLSSLQHAAGTTGDSLKGFGNLRDTVKQVDYNKLFAELLS